MKKILIVTLPIGLNYGGIMQAFALQKTLKSLGYNAETTNTRGSLGKALLKQIPGTTYLAGKFSPNYYRTISLERMKMSHTSSFIEKYIDYTPFWKAAIQANLWHYSTIIVGSDQVWRKDYAYLPHNFLKFNPLGRNNKISYAASFGKDHINDYSSDMLHSINKLAHKFDAISVREESGKAICKNYWEIDAVSHVDPTLLVHCVEYRDLLRNRVIGIGSSGQLFKYVLDVSDSKNEIVSMTKAALNLSDFEIITGDNDELKPLPPVTEWLASFDNASFVVTDSFHGCVFSIIFNKPFIAIGNKDRGLARFTSLLKTFELEDRLVSSPDEITEDLVKATIDWDKVNRIIKKERSRSLAYLKQHLGPPKDVKS